MEQTQQFMTRAKYVNTGLQERRFEERCAWSGLNKRVPLTCIFGEFRNGLYAPSHTVLSIGGIKARRPIPNGSEKIGKKSGNALRLLETRFYCFPH